VRRFLCLLAVLAVAGPAAADTQPLDRVTIITDSVGGAISWFPQARTDLGFGIDFQLEVRTCRKLVDTGCWSPIGPPPSALETIETLAADLGPVVAIDVGYNDEPDSYAAGLDEVMRAALAAGVQRVVWVTLEETTPGWLAIDDQIRDAAQRWPQLVVADWAGRVAGKPWLTDAAHLNEAGAGAFARFLRPIVLDALAAVFPPAEEPGGRAALVRRPD
jgi:hypothetical protein